MEYFCGDDSSSEDSLPDFDESCLKDILDLSKSGGKKADDTEENKAETGASCNGEQLDAVETKQLHTKGCYVVGNEFSGETNTMGGITWKSILRESDTGNALDCTVIQSIDEQGASSKLNEDNGDRQGAAPGSISRANFSEKTAASNVEMDHFEHMVPRSKSTASAENIGCRKSFSLGEEHSNERFEKGKSLRTRVSSNALTVERPINIRRDSSILPVNSQYHRNNSSFSSSTSSIYGFNNGYLNNYTDAVNLIETNTGRDFQLEMRKQDHATYNYEMLDRGLTNQAIVSCNRPSHAISRSTNPCTSWATSDDSALIPSISNRCMRKNIEYVGQTAALNKQVMTINDFPCRNVQPSLKLHVSNPLVYDQNAGTFQRNQCVQPQWRGMPNATGYQNMSNARGGFGCNHHMENLHEFWTSYHGRNRNSAIHYRASPPSYRESIQSVKEGNNNATNRAMLFQRMQRNHVPLTKFRKCNPLGVAGLLQDERLGPPDVPTSWDSELWTGKNPTREIDNDLFKLNTNSVLDERLAIKDIVVSERKGSTEEMKHSASKNSEFLIRKMLFGVTDNSASECQNSGTTNNSVLIDLTEHDSDRSTQIQIDFSDQSNSNDGYSQVDLIESNPVEGNTVKIDLIKESTTPEIIPAEKKITEREVAKDCTCKNTNAPSGSLHGVHNCETLLDKSNTVNENETEGIFAKVFPQTNDIYMANTSIEDCMETITHVDTKGTSKATDKNKKGNNQKQAACSSCNIKGISDIQENIQNHGKTNPLMAALAKEFRSDECLNFKTVSLNDIVDALVNKDLDIDVDTEDGSCGFINSYKENSQCVSLENTMVQTTLEKGAVGKSPHSVDKEKEYSFSYCGFGRCTLHKDYFQCPFNQRKHFQSQCSRNLLENFVDLTKVEMNSNEALMKLDFNHAHAVEKSEHQKLSTKFMPRTLSYHCGVRMQADPPELGVYYTQKTTAIEMEENIFFGAGNASTNACPTPNCNKHETFARMHLIGCSDKKQKEPPHLTNTKGDHLDQDNEGKTSMRQSDTLCVQDKMPILDNNTLETLCDGDVTTTTSDDSDRRNSTVDAKLNKLSDPNFEGIEKKVFEDMLHNAQNTPVEDLQKMMIDSPKYTLLSNFFDTNSDISDNTSIATVQSNNLDNKQNSVINNMQCADQNTQLKNEQHPQLDNKQGGLEKEQCTRIDIRDKITSQINIKTESEQNTSDQCSKVFNNDESMNIESCITKKDIEGNTKLVTEQMPKVDTEQKSEIDNVKDYKSNNGQSIEMQMNTITEKDTDRYKLAEIESVKDDNICKALRLNANTANIELKVKQEPLEFENAAEVRRNCNDILTTELGTECVSNDCKFWNKAEFSAMKNVSKEKCKEKTKLEEDAAYSIVSLNGKTNPSNQKDATVPIQWKEEHKEANLKMVNKTNTNVEVEVENGHFFKEIVDNNLKCMDDTDESNMELIKDMMHQLDMLSVRMTLGLNEVIDPENVSIGADSDDGDTGLTWGTDIELADESHVLALNNESNNKNSRCKDLKESINSTSNYSNKEFRSTQNGELDSKHLQYFCEPQNSRACDNLKFNDKSDSDIKDRIMFKKRVKERKTYTDGGLDDDDIEGRRLYKIEDKIINDAHTKEYVRKLKGEDFTLRYLQENGLQYPIIFREKSGLGLRVPSDNFKVSDVKACVGSRRVLDVMDVNTQKGLEMTMKEWTKYYENTDRDRLLNVISLEFSHTKLENYVESPNLVREIDWVDTAWPQHLKDCQTESTNAIDKMKYPKVQKYCLMSVQECYTDFHIDFGGTSVWYHILHGEKIFWLIPPTDKNLLKYEHWVLSGKQGEAFLADSVEECQMIRLVAGNTFIIPSGWIHAVYTPKDSLVFGGNFLHNFNMVNQLKVSAIEDKTHVPTKFRYPFYAEINWYVLERYVHSLTGVTYLEKPQLNEDLELVTSKSDKDLPNLEMLEEKLNKRLSVSLTRIDDASPRRRSTSDDDSTASGPTRSPGQASAQPRLSRRSSSESMNSLDMKLSDRDDRQAKAPYKSPVKKHKKHVHLTKFELEGLIEVVSWIENLPASKKGVPKDLIDPEAVLKEIKALIKEHVNDNPELAITGEPVLEWTKATKKLIKLKQKAKTAKLMGVSGPKPSKVGGKVASGSRRRRVRCKQCEPCTREDCQECSFCKDMKKYGGPGRAKQSCISRQCLRPNLPNCVTCQICNAFLCGLDKPVKEDGATDDEEDFCTSIMECGICWEIVHPLCLSAKYPELSNTGVVNEDLPNSWKCTKCCFDGKEGQLKARVFKGGWRPNASSTPPPLSVSPPPMMEDTLSPSQQENVANIVTEGKRVTMPSLSSSPVKLEPGLMKTENGSGDYPTLPINKQSLVRMKGDNSSMAVKTEVLESRPQKRKHSPEAVPGKKKRETSPSVVKSSGAHKPRSSTKPSSSPRSSPALNKTMAKDPSPTVMTTKRSKREIANLYTYDFEDDPMDISTPLPSEKGKGKSPKGKKSVQSKSSKDPLHQVTKLATKAHSFPAVDTKSTDLSRLSLKQNNDGLNKEQLKKTLIEHIGKRNLPVVKPRFAVRPVPIVAPEEYVLKTNGQSHPLSFKLWSEIFKYLSQADLARCLAVCKVWNCWAISPCLWKKIDLSRKRIVQSHLIGIVRRQPVYLNLSAVVMTQKQILWLLERLPLLKTLILSKCSWATLSGLCMSSCPLLYHLDISWATGLSDKCFEDLIMPPVDRKPAVTNISRLHRLKSLNVSGSEITDMSLGLLAANLTQLEHLNVSYCTRVTDQGIQMLTSMDAPMVDTLNSLNISGCRQLTGVSIDALNAFTNLTELETVNCIRIPIDKNRALHQSRKLKVFKF